MLAASTTLDRYRGRELTLEELVEAASRGLHRLELRSDDGRVAEAMDARGVRYYQTLGVIDRPVRYDGRRAVYGYRHLLQLLCVKKLQQEGHSLQLIQRALAARSTEALERGLLQSEASPPPVPSRKPEPVAAHRRKAGPQQPQTDSEVRPAETPALVAAQVAPGITVTVDTTQVPDARQVIEEIRKFLC